MKKTKLIFAVLGSIALFLPISNLMGLAGDNPAISPVIDASNTFAKVTTIFQNKCVDCHSPGMTRMPIYAELPVAKQLMASDIKNATARFLITESMYSGENAFTPLMLARIEGALRNDTMPPALYLSMHWTGSLNDEEKSLILAWIAEERSKLPWSVDAVSALKGEPVHPLPLQLTQNQQKVELGRQLFFDKRLSGDNTLNCASCHSLAKAERIKPRWQRVYVDNKAPSIPPVFITHCTTLPSFGMAERETWRSRLPVPLQIPAKWGVIGNTS